MSTIDLCAAASVVAFAASVSFSVLAVYLWGRLKTEAGATRAGFTLFCASAAIAGVAHMAAWPLLLTAIVIKLMR